MYSICLKITDKLCTVIGGGPVAERKVRGLMAQGARIRVVSPALTPQLEELAGGEQVEWVRRGYRPGDLAGSSLVFAATDKREVQRAVREEAEGANLLLNMADDPEGCDFHVPAVIHRGDLNIAVSTSGKSPAVAAMVRRKLASVIGDEYGVLLALVALVREAVIAGARDEREKRKMFRKLLQEDILDLIKAGQWDRVEAIFGEVLGPHEGIDWKSIRREFP